MLKDDEVPQVPGRILTSAHMNPDKILYHFPIEKTLFFDEIFREIFINEKSEFFSEPCTDGHFETPLRPVMKGRGKEGIEREIGYNY